MEGAPARDASQRYGLAGPWCRPVPFHWLDHQLSEKIKLQIS